MKKLQMNSALPGALLSLSLIRVIKVFVSVYLHHYSSISALIIIVNSGSADFCSVIERAIMTDVLCIVCCRLEHDCRASRQAHEKQ